MSLQCEVLPDRSEIRQERLRALRIAETTHAALAFARGLMTIFGSVVHSGAGFDENVLHVFQFRDLGLRRRIAAQLVSDNLARHLRTSRQYTFEEPFRCGLVAPLLQQDIKFGAMLIDCPSQ
jgi:hypothetical protein